MRNQIEGLDKNNETIWVSQQTHEGWMGTAKGYMLIWHSSPRVAAEFYMASFPNTDTIRSMINDKFYFTMPSQLKARSLLDIVAEELRLDDAG